MRGPRLGPATARLAAVGALCTVLLCLPAAAAQAAPLVDAAWSSEVVATSARLHAEVDPEGAAAAYHFDYISEAAYEANLGAGREGFAGAARAPAGTDPSLGSGSAAVAVFQTVAGLSSETAYRYRVVATGGGGSAEAVRSLTTQGFPGASILLDGRGWEMVSPVDKNGGEIQGPGQIFGGGVLKASASGQAITYSSTASFGAAPQGAPPASQYISRRGAEGWSTENISEPTLAGDYGDHPDGVPFQLFSSDLERGLLLDGRRCAGAEPCPRGYSIRDSAGGALTPLPAGAAGMSVIGASPDLARIVFEDGAGEDFQWSGGGLVPRSLLPPGAGPTAVFQAASADGRFAFYLEGGSLYRYDTQVGAAADLTPAGGVDGVLGISEAGGVAYYQDAAGLERWDEGGAAQIAPGPEAAEPGDWPPATGTARVSPDGQTLVFVSRAPLTGYENIDQGSGQADSEVFLWSASGGLLCASCNPTGERPVGPSSIPDAVANGEGAGATRLYKPRVLSAGGRRLFFDSSDALALTDTNRAPDAYEWEAPGEGSCGRPGGCVALISSGRSSEGAEFIDASADGLDAFFLTDGSLVGSDPGSTDLYDARVGGGFPEPENPIACEGDACQALPPEPEDPEPGTLQVGPGNPPLPPAKARKCKKGLVRKHGSCTRKAHRPRHHRRGHR